MTVPISFETFFLDPPILISRIISRTSNTIRTLLFRRVLLPCLSTDLAHSIFCRHFLSHPFLLEIVLIPKVSLSFSVKSVGSVLTGYSQ